MTAEELYILVFTILDKNGGQGDFTTEEFNIIANRAQYGYQDYLIGQIQQYQYGRPIARVDYSQNEKIRHRLRQSIYNINLTITSQVSAYPSGYLLKDSMLTTDNQVIRFASQDRLANMLDDEIDPVDDNPIYTIATNGFTFYPDTLAAAKLAYIKRATPIVYAVTLDGNDREIYDAANSVSPVWDEIDCLEIAVRMLAMMGVTLQLQQVQGYAQNIKTQGQ